MKNELHIIEDASDFCRACKGVGYEIEQSSDGLTRFLDCFWCNGRGFRAVIIGKPRNHNEEIQQVRAEFELECG